MDILVVDAWLSLCDDQKQQQKILGKVGAKKLRARLADLAAAARVTDLVLGDPHPLGHDRAGQFALRLHGGWRLVFEPAHDPPPQSADGAIAWDQVTAVRIVWIGDYHD